MADWLEEGSKLPAFTLTDDNGKKLKSAVWKGSPLVVYFYPKDDTPGCTKEACAFRDASTSLRELGANVIGISGDSVASHAKFRDKYKLNFPLLADFTEIERLKYKDLGLSSSGSLLNSSPPPASNLPAGRQVSHHQPYC